MSITSSNAYEKLKQRVYSDLGELGADQNLEGYHTEEFDDAFDAVRAWLREENIFVSKPPAKRHIPHLAVLISHYLKDAYEAKLQSDQNAAYVILKNMAGREQLTNVVKAEYF